MGELYRYKKKKNQEVDDELIFIHFSPLLVKATLTGQW